MGAEFDQVTDQSSEEKGLVEIDIGIFKISHRDHGGVVGPGHDRKGRIGDFHDPLWDVGSVV